MNSSFSACFSVTLILRNISTVFFFLTITSDASGCASVTFFFIELSMACSFVGQWAQGGIDPHIRSLIDESGMQKENLKNAIISKSQRNRKINSFTHETHRSLKLNHLFCPLLLHYQDDTKCKHLLHASLNSFFNMWQRMTRETWERLERRVLPGNRFTKPSHVRIWIRTYTFHR